MLKLELSEVTNGDVEMLSVVAAVHRGSGSSLLGT